MFEVTRVESLVGNVLHGIDVASMRSEGEAFDAGSFAVLVDQNDDMTMPFFVFCVAVD